MNKVIIADSSPIINLIKVSKLTLLKSLYGKVIIPQAVFDEINKPEYKVQAEKVKSASYIQIKSIREEDERIVERLMTKNTPKLHRGESEVLVLGKEINADLVIIDEQNGRKVAKLRYGFPTIGAVGIILRSFEKEYLDEDDVNKIISIWKVEDKRGLGKLLEREFEKLQNKKGYKP